MHIRKTFAALCASLLAVTIIGFGFSWSAWHVLGQPNYLKTTLRESGIYKTISEEILTKNGNQLLQGTGLSANQSAAQDVINSAIAPYVQQQTEKVIDSSFGWLQGNNDTLQPNVDLSGAQQKIADGVAAYTKERLSSLPACTASSPAVTDPLQATCLPAGFNIDAAAEQTKANVLSSPALANTDYNANEIKAGDGKTLEQQLQSGRKTYQRIQLALYLQAVLAVLLAIALVLLSVTWRIGMRRVGVIALWTGALSALLGWLSSVGMHFAAKKIAHTAFGAQTIQQKLVSIAEMIIDDIRLWWVHYGIAVAAFGAFLLIAYWFFRPSPATVTASLAKNAGTAPDADTNNTPSPMRAQTPNKSTVHKLNKRRIIQ